MTIPTLQQLYSQVLADLESEMNITIPLFGKSFLRALAMVQAAKLWMLYLRLSFVQKNTWVDTCDSDTLDRFGFVKLGRYRYPATQGKYLCSVNGSVGATINGGTQFISNDDSQSPGKLFVLDITYVCTGSSDEIELRALEAGDDSRLFIGNTLTSVVPISLVDSILTVTSETLQPDAAEDIEDFRRKVIDSFQLMPQGGAPADYRLWSSEVAGIVQTYPYTASGNTNQVNLFIEGDTVNGVPSPTDINNVRDNIELPTSDRPARKPATDLVNYLAVTPLTIDIEISSFVGTPPASLIESAIISALSDVRPFVDSIDIVSNRNDLFSTNNIIQIILEVQPGSSFGAITMEVDGVVESSHQFTDGDIPLLGIISYV